MQFKLNTLFTDLKAYIWDTDEDKYAYWPRKGIIALRILCLLIRDLREGQLNLRAMGLVYTTLLAIVPLIAVSFSVLKGFGVHNQVEPWLLSIMESLGEKGVEITTRIIDFVDNIKAGILGSLGLAFLIYTSVSLLQKIERAFNFTWRVTTHRPLSQRFTDYITLVLIGPVLIFSALGVTASISNITLVQQVMQIEAIGFMFNLLGYLVPFLMIVTIFTLVYKLVPNVDVKVKSAIIGAAVAGILWQVLSWAFSSFVVGSTKYTAIYSAFATLIIFMIWLYLNWLVLLIGCSISFYYQHPERRTLISKSLMLSNRMREKLALQIMVVVARNYYQHKGEWTLDTLAKHLNVDVESCQSVVAELIDGRLLARTEKIPTTYLPGYAIETLLLKDILNQMRSSGETAEHSADHFSQDEAINKIFSELEKATDTVLGNKTLRDMVKEDNS